MSDLTITAIPATGSTTVFGAVAYVTLEGDVARRTFTSTDTSGRTYTNRLISFTLYEDGSVWAWAANINKRTGEPFKNGMGLTMGSAVAESYGQDVADVIAEAIAKVETANGALVRTSDGRYEIPDTKDEAPAVPVTLADGAIQAWRYLIGTAAGLTTREASTLADALDVMERHPMLAKVLAGIILAEVSPAVQHVAMCTGYHGRGEPCSR